MTIKWDADLDGLRVEGDKIVGVKCGLLRAEDQHDLEPGDVFFRLISATFIDEIESKGQHNLYVDVVDEDRNRLDGSTVLHGWPWNKWPDEDEHVTDKVYGGHLANWGIYAGYDAHQNEYGPYWTKVEGISDVFYGIGLPWNRHVSWSVVFQRTVFGERGGGGGGGGGGTADLSELLARLDALDARMQSMDAEVRGIREALRQAGDALKPS